MSTRLTWIFGVSLVLFMTLTPFFYYRWSYTTQKRLRVVEEGKLYRSGCLTVDGFEDAVKKYRIRTILNLQEEAPDPDIAKSYWSLSSEKESELCKRLGVKYVFMTIDLQADRNKAPESIAAFKELVEDKNNLPILVHCRAGLHRTGVIIARYRMEYDGWSHFKALQELRAHGFGRIPSYAPNEYIRQYIVDYQPPEARTTTGILTNRTKTPD